MANVYIGPYLKCQPQMVTTNEQVGITCPRCRIDLAWEFHKFCNQCGTQTNPLRQDNARPSPEAMDIYEQISEEWAYDSGPQDDVVYWIPNKTGLGVHISTQDELPADYPLATRKSDLDAVRNTPAVQQIITAYGAERVELLEGIVVLR